MKTDNWLHTTLIPLILMICTPPTAIVVWYTNVYMEGSLTSLWTFLSNNDFIRGIWLIWKPVFWGSPTAWGIIGLFAAVQLALMRLVPGKKFFGPITPMGNVPEYRANGPACFFITMALFVLGAHPFGLYDLSIVYFHFGEILGALNIFSLLFCLVLYLKGLIAPSCSDRGSSGNPIFDYYWGTELYPRILGWDVKVFTNCRFGMMSWGLILISYAAAQSEMYGLSNTMVIAVAIQLAYITKFFLWETGYLCTLDIMYDRAGYYICWGCLVWVPGIYTAATQYLVNHPIDLPIWAAALILILGVTSVMINYWADLQRQLVRETNGECKVWGKKPELIHATYTTKDGEKKQSLLLTSGWWGIARHFHYVPEILSAFFWTVPALFTHLLPYFYVIFLIILLCHRALRDEERCLDKYGNFWIEYCNRVPYLIIPPIQLTRKKEEVLDV